MHTDINHSLFIHNPAGCKCDSAVGGPSDMFFFTDFKKLHMYNHRDHKTPLVENNKKKIQDPS